MWWVKRIGEDYYFKTNIVNSVTKHSLVAVHVHPVQVSQIVPHYFVFMDGYAFWHEAS